jgi:protein-tyrosine phosphatase
MMDVFWIPSPLGRLATATRPRGGDWLDEDVGQIARDTTMLVSMLTRPEMEELNLVGEASAARRANLHFLNIAIDDRGVPEQAAPFVEAVTSATKILLASQTVVVHCRMGVGRSSLFAAACLVRLGVTPDDAWTSIAAARGRPVPDVPTQRDWLQTSRSLFAGC